jgi:hypothetical protein
MSPYEKGKDVVIDFEFIDGFDSNNELWYDNNGLDMHKKRIWERTEYDFHPTDNIAANFYPVHSAIAIRDKNSKK